MAARVGDAGGTSSARRRRERRQRSWWRHEQLSVAAALSSARHHSAGPGVVSRRDEQQEEVEQDTYDAPRGLYTAPPGTRPGVLQDPGPPWVEAVTVEYVAAGPSLTVVSVSDDRIDDAALQLLLQQSLLARAEEEEKAREGGHWWRLLDNLSRRLCRHRPLRGAREEEGEEEEEEEEIVVAVLMSLFHEPLVSDNHLLVLVLFACGEQVRDSCVSLSWLFVQFLGDYFWSMFRTQRNAWFDSGYNICGNLRSVCSYLFGSGLPEECVRGFFWETTSGFIPVFSVVWVDSGYMFASIHRGRVVFTHCA